MTRRKWIWLAVAIVAFLVLVVIPNILIFA